MGKGSAISAILERLEKGNFSRRKKIAIYILIFVLLFPPVFSSIAILYIEYLDDGLRSFAASFSVLLLLGVFFHWHARKKSSGSGVNDLERSFKLAEKLEANRNSKKC